MVYCSPSNDGRHTAFGIVARCVSLFSLVLVFLNYDSFQLPVATPHVFAHLGNLPTATTQFITSLSQSDPHVVSVCVDDLLITAPVAEAPKGEYREILSMTSCVLGGGVWGAFDG